MDLQMIDLDAADAVMFGPAQPQRCPCGKLYRSKFTSTPLTAFVGFVADDGSKSKTSQEKKGRRVDPLFYEGNIFLLKPAVEMPEHLMDKLRCLSASGDFFTSLMARCAVEIRRSAPKMASLFDQEGLSLKAFIVKLLVFAVKPELFDDPFSEVVHLGSRKLLANRMTREDFAKARCCLLDALSKIESANVARSLANESKNVKEPSGGRDDRRSSIFSASTAEPSSSSHLDSDLGLELVDQQPNRASSTQGYIVASDRDASPKAVADTVVNVRKTGQAASYRALYRERKRSYQQLMRQLRERCRREAVESGVAVIREKEPSSARFFDIKDVAFMNEAITRYCVAWDIFQPLP
ncbi:unnamed protein product [Vitrella brassicaformis CCMP3155]|uniref:Uncharacterized protein n=1 Tax=Vitrella brassicaformis (strain CCMP3155) TaxID=1169540 RepID=A0A0G4GHH6_VITBC|nr:unnamed protein product [Vitrella brassicaformis CCMP3155]|eukprot:CEM29177.1 unnamed protein product [Vitrella brassicaformis CCMP3155]